LSIGPSIIPSTFDAGLPMELFSEPIKTDHVLSRIDARIKLIVMLAFLAMVLSSKGLLFPLLSTSFCLFLCLTMRVPLRVMGLRFSEPLFVTAVLLLLKLFLAGEAVLFSVDILGVKIVGYQDGLIEGLRIGSRVMGAVSVLIVMGCCTPFTEFLASLSWLKVPQDLIEISLFAHRYIFVLLDESAVIYHAQKNRLGYSNLRRSVSSFGILSGSLVLKAFEHGQNMVVAMVQRGYDGHMPRLTFGPLKTSEILGSVTFIILTGFLWMI
jgi:cobalt/nickel transport system permease protein